MFHGWRVVTAGVQRSTICSPVTHSASMRIAYLLTSSGIGGAERAAIALAEQMASRGCDVRLLVLVESPTDHWKTDLPVLHLNFRKDPSSVLRGVSRAIAELRAFRPDIIHAHCFHSNLLARLLKLALSGVRVISTVHNVYEGGRMRMLAYRSTDALSACTAFVCASSEARYLHMRAVSPHRSVVIPNGIEVANWVPDMEHRSAARKRIGVTSEFVWIVVGRIVPAKDYRTLLLAWRQICEEAASIHLWIVGEGIGAYAESMRRLCAELGIGSTVSWLGVRRDIADLLDAADAVVSSSAWEGMPLALAEAMAMGKPVVATNVGGAQELISDCGLLVNAKQPQELATAMASIMAMSAQERARFGARGRNRIEKEFTIGRNTEAWARLYASL